MDPSKATGSSSRRSSILKPPKPRQPLQNLNFHTSFDEDSPTCTPKLKRRVSFAEKKHVKEFCNSLEQGTVWDDTYEEHDLSSLRGSCTSNEKENETENESKKNIQIDEFHELVYVNSETTDECSMQGNNVQYEQVIARDLVAEDSDLDFTNTVGGIQSTHTLLIKENVVQHASSVAFPSMVEPKDSPVSPAIVRLSNNRGPQNITVYEDSDENQLNNCCNLNATCTEDVNMEFTEAICSVVRSGTEGVQTSRDASMELTQLDTVLINIPGAINNFRQELNTENIPTISCNFQQENISRIKDCDSSSVVHVNGNDQRTTIFHDVSMEITKPVKPSIFTYMACQEEADDDLTIMKEVPQYKCDITCTNEKTMEMTKPVSVNIHFIPKNQEVNSMNSEITTADDNFEKLRADGNCSKLSVNFVRAESDDVLMEFTTPLTSLLTAHSGSSKSNKPAENISSAREHPRNSMPNNSRNNNTNVMSNKTVYHNNSMTITAVVSASNARNTSEENVECDKATILPNISMEITQAAMPLQSQYEESVLDDNKVKELVLSEYFENKSQTAVPDNVLTDSIEIPVTVDSNMLVNEKNYVIDNTQNLKDSFATEHIPDEVWNPINARTSMALHDSTKQDTSALALKENNTRAASASPNSVSKDPTYAVTSELNKSDCSQHEYSQNIQSHPTRTYTVKPLSTDHSIMNSNKENNETLKANCDIFCHETNNKENSVFNTLNETDHLPEGSNEESLLAKGITCLSESTVHIESITPPSFIYVGDSLLDDVSVNAYNQEFNVETSCSAVPVESSEIIEHEHISLNYKNHSLALDNQIDVLEEDRSNSQTESRLKCQIQTIETREMQLSQTNCINTENQVLQCSLSTVSDTEERPISNVEKHYEDVEMQNICADNSDTNDQSMEYLSPTMSDAKQRPISNVEKDFEDARMQNICADNSNTNDESMECLSPTISDIEQRPVPDVEKHYEDVEMQNVCANNSNTNDQSMACLSPTISDTEQRPTSNVERHEDVEAQNLCADNSNINDQSIECSSSKICDVDKTTSAHNNDNSHLSNDEPECSVDRNTVNRTNINVKEHLGPCISSLENEISVELDSFSLLMKELKTCSLSDDIIWSVYHENIEKKLFVIGFISCSLLVVVYLRNDDTTSVQFIENIKIISLLADDADALIYITHKLILEKIDVKRVMDLYRTSEDILSMLDHVSKEVKLAMDFMFELKRLGDLNLMEITRDSVSFVSRTERLDIILRITINMKPFDKIEPQDISIRCLLGSVRENDIKKLIVNVKKDHRFLRRFIRDVKDYVYLMEVSNNVI